MKRLFYAAIAVLAMTLAVIITTPQQLMAQQPAPVVAGKQDRANYESNYPNVCIPLYPPDLDCGDIEPRRFTVNGDDPHGFDGDKDGVGCEG